MDSDFPQKNMDKAELSGRKNLGPRFRNPDLSVYSDNSPLISLPLQI